MKLETISLQGVLRFAERVDLDLRDLPAGLIAFTGPNGEGKTTTLETPLAALYREFPSRADRELVDYVNRTDGYVDITFELEGQGLYRAHVSLDGPHRKSEATLQRILPGGETAFLNDGKLTTYDAAVSRYLPPKALMLASVFAAQNRNGSFVSTDRKGRKQLFSVLLGLDHYDALAERAKSAGGLVQQAVDTLTATRDVLARDAGETVEQALEQRAQQLQAASGQVEVRRAELARQMADLETEIAELAEAVARHAAARSRLDTLAVERGQVVAERSRTKDLLDRAPAELRVALDGFARALTTEQHAAAAERDAILKDAGERIANNQTVLEQGAAIRAAVDAIRAIDAAVAEIVADQQAWHAQADGLRRRERTLVDAMSVFDQMARQLARAETDAALLTAVPCEGAGPYAGCGFLTNAIAAQGQIAGLRDGLKAMPATQAELATVREQLTGLAAALGRHRATLDDHEREKRTKQPLAARLESLTQAQERIDAHAQRKIDATEACARRAEAAVVRHDTQVAEQTERSAARVREVTEQLGGFLVREQTLAQQTADLGAELAATGDAAERSAAKAEILRTARREWDATIADLSRAQSTRDEILRQVADVRAKRVELETVQARIAEAMADLVEWQLLAKALGRDGLPVLEIDAAGPTVSAYCNDLLQTCFGSRFSVELVTQEAKITKGKDGSTMRDAFELKVFDGERGGDARDLSDLSGGEQVLVDEALKSAIALFVNQRNPHPIRTCWRDETTGALHPDAAPKYVDMLRRVQQLGGFWHVLFVTHNPDAAMQADAQVRVGGGRIEIALPPYAERPAA